MDKNQILQSAQTLETSRYKLITVIYFEDEFEDEKNYIIAALLRQEVEWRGPDEEEHDLWLLEEPFETEQWEHVCTEDVWEFIEDRGPFEILWELK